MFYWLLSNLHLQFVKAPAVQLLLKHGANCNAQVPLPAVVTLVTIFSSENFH